MLEPLLLKKKTAEAGLVMALDFEGTSVKDSVVPSRTFANAGSGGSLNFASSPVKNGTQSLYQGQADSAPSYYATTSASPDLIFTGDFWCELWGYCLGQGNTTYTAGYNTMLSYGAYQATGGMTRWLLNNLKPCLSLPSGNVEAILFTGNIACANNAWYHHAIGRRGSTVYMFVNGVLAGTGSYSGVFGHGSNLNIVGYNDARIGGATYAGFNGYIDRLRIYSQCLYTSAFTPGTGLYPN